MNVETVSPEKLAKVMKLINDLLARADHPNTPVAEADMSRERAEILMFRYKVEEASLDAESKAKMGIKPRKVEWTISTLGNEFATQYGSMAAYVVNHVGAYAVRGWGRGDNNGWNVYEVYGFESDLAYGEMLWNSIRIAFKSQLEPKLDPSLSEMENVYRMRNAGMERIRIAMVMGFGDTGSATGKVTRLFKKACAAKGENSAVLLGKGNNVKTFRRSYADSFAEEMWSRLLRLRTARGQNSHEIVLANRMDEIMELLYTDHPSLRPNTGVAQQGTTYRKQRARKYVEPKVNYDARERGRDAARRVDLGPTGTPRLG